MNVYINEIRKGLNCLEGNSENLENAKNAMKQISSISMGNFTPVCEDYYSNINNYLAQISHISTKLNSIRSDNTDFIFLANSIYNKLLALSGVPDYNALEEVASFDGHNWWMNGEIIDADEWLIENASKKKFIYDPYNIISANTFNNNYLKRNSNAEANCLYIYSELVNKYGYTHDFAIAALNNIAEESAFDNASTNLDSGQYSAGICHWRNSDSSNMRLDELLKYAQIPYSDDSSEDEKAKLAAGIDLDTQIRYMNYEIETKFNKQQHPELNNMQDLYSQAHGNTTLSKNQQSRDFTLVYEVPEDGYNAATRRSSNYVDIEALLDKNKIDIID